MGIFRDQVGLQEIRDGNGAVGHQGIAIQPQKPVGDVLGKDLQSHLQHVVNPRKPPSGDHIYG